MKDEQLSISDKLSHIIFITGGTKSGKSEFAEHLAKDSINLSYIALSKNNPNDEEWQKKLIYIEKEGQKIGN